MPIPSKEAGLLLEHANIITLDPNRPRAEAVLCRNGVIQAVGDIDELEPLFREGDTRFDCGELTLVPGFIDSHTHFMAMGLRALRADLSEVRDRDGLFEVLRQRAADTPGGGWVLGVDFDETRWSGEQRLPDREELDGLVSPRHPVVARRVCGHIAVANTAALELIGPEWMVVDRRTGMLLEDVALRLSEIVGVTDEEAKAALQLATRRAYREGVTAVVDMADARTLKTYMEMEVRGELAIRVFCTVQARDMPVLETAGIKVDSDPSRGLLQLRGVKAFLDGSIGARTAALSEPYTDDPDDPDNRGMLLFAPDELVDLVSKAEAAGFQLFLHAIGDRAVDAALDAIEAAASPGNPLRHRIEHLEVARPDQLKRMKELRVVASMQPNFIVQWAGPGRMNERRLGPERARRSEAVRDVWGQGIPLAFGSDDMPFGPLYGLHGAIHHPVEEQSLPPVVALRAYTEGSAWAVHAEGWMGSVQPGKLADLVLLSRDPEECDDLREARAVMTVLGGFIVHVESEAFNEAVNRKAQEALEEALMQADSVRVGLEGPREDEEGDE